MNPIVCPECGAQNPVEAVVCEQCNADLSPVRTLIDTANHHYNKALALAHEGQLDEAIGQLEAAISLSSQNPLFYNLLGTLNARKGLYSEAIRAWENALALNPEMERAYENIQKAQRLEQERAEEDEQRPLRSNFNLACGVAAVFFLLTVLLGAKVVLQARSIKQIAADYEAKKTEAASWQTQFQALNTKFGAGDIEQALKQLAENQAVLGERDRRIQELQGQIQSLTEKNTENTLIWRERIRRVQEENEKLRKEAEQLAQAQDAASKSETQIETLKQTISNLEEAVRLANERAEKHRNNLLLAQDNIRTLKEARDHALENLQKAQEQAGQTYRDEILKLRNEIAVLERKLQDRDYADSMTVEALQNLEATHFDLAMRNAESALERIPGHPAASYLRATLDRILADPLEQEIRIQEAADREKKRGPIKQQLVERNLREATRLLQSGKYEEAAALAHRTLALEPDNPKDANNLRTLLKQAEEANREITLLLLEAKQNIAENNPQKALESLEKVLKRAPAHEEALTLKQQAGL
ncbi:MAG: tetratricopeptide repeat protein [Candidatus Omnitrophica bacterium]|nr:tetratricopeptide repeat protein [Candidatus Omnitrophota bacterium]